MVISSWGKDNTDQKIAASIDRQIDAILERLPHLQDSTKYYKALTEAFRSALVCDYYDSRQDEKGRVKLKYRDMPTKIVMMIINTALKIVFFRPFISTSGFFAKSGS